MLDGVRMAQANKPKKMTEVTKDQISGVHSLIKKKNIQIVDLKFNDLPGLWQHFSIPCIGAERID
jgi:glutamine synthetase